MKSLQRKCLPHLLTSVLMTACLAWSGVALAQSGQLVSPIGDKPLKLYDAPGQPSTQTYPEKSALTATGAESKGFIPVLWNGKQYWVDALDVRRERQSKAPCTQSAGVPAAGTLGAATNRCAK